MTRVILERSYNTPITYDTLLDGDRAMEKCLTQDQATWVRSLMAQDHRHLICEFEAKDAESIRLACRKAAIAFDRAWSAETYSSGQDGLLQNDQPLIIVETTSPSSMSEAKWGTGIEPHMNQLNVTWMFSQLSSDRRRAIDVFQAPDGETVQAAYFKAGLTFERVWTAKFLAPAIAV